MEGMHFEVRLFCSVQFLVTCLASFSSDGKDGRPCDGMFLVLSRLARPKKAVWDSQNSLLACLFLVLVLTYSES